MCSNCLVFSNQTWTRSDWSISLDDSPNPSTITILELPRAMSINSNKSGQPGLVSVSLHRNSWSLKQFNRTKSNKSMCSKCLMFSHQPWTRSDWSTSLDDPPNPSNITILELWKRLNESMDWFKHSKSRRSLDDHNIFHPLGSISNQCCTRIFRRYLFMDQIALLQMSGWSKVGTISEDRVYLISFRATKS
jgi:hypothetical protein